MNLVRGIAVQWQCLVKVVARSREVWWADPKIIRYCPSLLNSQWFATRVRPKRHPSRILHKVSVSYNIRIQVRFVVSQEFAEIFVDELRFVALLHVGRVEIQCRCQEVVDYRLCCIGLAG